MKSAMLCQLHLLLDQKWKAAVFLHHIVETYDVRARNLRADIGLKERDTIEAHMIMYNRKSLIKFIYHHASFHIHSRYSVRMSEKTKNINGFLQPPLE